MDSVTIFMEDLSKITKIDFKILYKEYHYLISYYIYYG